MNTNEAFNQDYPWCDDNIQFARLLAEINATQDNLDFVALCESMDLEMENIKSLFERADKVWEILKSVLYNN